MTTFLKKERLRLWEKFRLRKIKVSLSCINDVIGSSRQVINWGTYWCCHWWMPNSLNRNAGGEFADVLPFRSPNAVARLSPLLSFILGYQKCARDNPTAVAHRPAPDLNLWLSPQDFQKWKVCQHSPVATYTTTALVHLRGILPLAPMTCQEIIPLQRPWQTYCGLLGSRPREIMGWPQ